MGAYIIHFDDKPWEDLDDELYYRCFEIPWFSTTKTTISRLTPYTEDSAYAHGYTEAESKYRKIRDEMEKQAYQRGYETGYKDGYNEPGKNQQEAYQRGINDAREGKASCQFCRFTDVRQDMEPCASCSNNYDNKFEPEEQITKGDIVLIKSTPEVEILVTYADEEYVSGIALTEVDGNCEIGDQYTNIRISNVEKTGKHYDIVSVLRKMRENNG